MKVEKEEKTNNTVEVITKDPILELPNTMSVMETEEGNNERVKRAIQYTMRDQEKLYAEQDAANIELQNATNQLFNVKEQLDVLLERLTDLQRKMTKKGEQLKILTSGETKPSDKTELSNDIIYVHEHNL